MESPSEQRVGSDRVVVREDRLIIESPTEMDGWEVRVYRRLLVRYAGRDWTRLLRPRVPSARHAEARGLRPRRPLRSM